MATLIISDPELEDLRRTLGPDAFDRLQSWLLLQESRVLTYTESQEREVAGRFGHRTPCLEAEALDALAKGPGLYRHPYDQRYLFVPANAVDKGEVCVVALEQIAHLPEPPRERTTPVRGQVRQLRRAG